MMLSADKLAHENAITGRSCAECIGRSLHFSVSGLGVYRDNVEPYIKAPILLHVELLGSLYSVSYDMSTSSFDMLI